MQVDAHMKKDIFFCSGMGIGVFFPLGKEWFSHVLDVSWCTNYPDLILPISMHVTEGRWKMALGLWLFVLKDFLLMQFNNEEKNFSKLFGELLCLIWKQWHEWEVPIFSLTEHMNVFPLIIQTERYWFVIKLLFG